MIWHLDQIPAKGIEQINEWYAEFPIVASACAECGVCLERCPFEVERASPSLVDRELSETIPPVIL